MGGVIRAACFALVLGAPALARADEPRVETHMRDRSLATGGVVVSLLGTLFVVPGIAFIYGAASQDPNPPPKTTFVIDVLEPSRDAKFILGGTLTALGGATLVAGVACMVYGAWEVPVDQTQVRVWFTPGGVVGTF